MSENITENNSTTFLVYLLNPPWNDYPKYVVLRMWSPEYDELGLRVNGEPPNFSFDQGVGWEFHHDLEPGHQALYTATVEWESGPGNYSIFASGWFIENGEPTTDIVQANLTIEAIPPPPPPPPPSLWERVVGLLVGAAETIVGAIVGVVIWIVNNPVKALTVTLTVIGVFAGVSQLLIALYGKERFLAGLKWPVRQIRNDGQRSGEQEQDNPE